MFKVVIVQKGKLCVLSLLNPEVFSQASVKRKLKSEREASLALALIVAEKILALGTL